MFYKTRIMKTYQVSFNEQRISKHIAHSEFHAIELAKTANNMHNFKGIWKAYLMK